MTKSHFHLPKCKYREALKLTWPRNCMVKTLPLRTRRHGNSISIRSFTTNFFHAPNSSNTNSPLGYSSSGLTTLPLSPPDSSESAGSFSFSADDSSFCVSEDKSKARIERFRWRQESGRGWRERGRCGFERGEERENREGREGVRRGTNGRGLQRV